MSYSDPENPPAPFVENIHSRIKRAKDDASMMIYHLESMKFAIDRKDTDGVRYNLMKAKDFHVKVSESLDKLE